VGYQHARSDWEEGHDDYQHIIREAADQVYARRSHLWLLLDLPPLVESLILHLWNLIGGGAI
jgi:hypothetical protein